MVQNMEFIQENTSYKLTKIEIEIKMNCAITKKEMIPKL